MNDGGPLYLIRGTINEQELTRWMNENSMQDRDFAIHCLLRESFGSEKGLQPFRATNKAGEVRSFIYGYSASAMEELATTALFSQGPVEAKVLPPSSLEGKEMPSTWEEGQKASFEIRTKPVIRVAQKREYINREMRPIAEERNLKPRSEIDVMQWERMKAGFHRRNPPRPEEVYTEWLRKKLLPTGAATLENKSVKLVSIRDRPLQRQRGGKTTQSQEVVMRGTLRIADPKRFNNLLTKGLGRHKSYGYGMLLLGPPPAGA